MTETPQQRAYAIVSELALRGAPDANTLATVTALGVDAIPALRDAAAFDEPRLRRFAVQALAALGSRKTIATLLNIVDEERARTGDLCAIALRGVVDLLEPADAAKVGPFLCELGAHPDRFVRAAVADGLATLDADAHHDTLLRLTHDADAHVADTAKAALERVGASPLATPRGLLDRIEDLATSDHERAMALRELQWDDDLDADALGRAMDRWSHHPDLFVRSEAFAAGIRCGVPYADELLARALRDPDLHVRERALAAYADAPADRSGAATPVAVERVRRAAQELRDARPLTEPDALPWLWRGLAARAAAGAYVDPALVDDANAATRAQASAIRSEARRFLVAWGHEQAAPQAGAADVAAWLAAGTATGLTDALDALEHNDHRLPDHTDALIDALYRADAPATARIARLLATIGSDRATQARERLRAHPDARVRVAAGALPEPTETPT